VNEKRARFDAQVLPHLDAAYRFAKWLARSPADADDLVQEAILRAFRGFEGLRGSDVRSWLLAIVRNCHFTAVARRKRYESVPLPEEHDARDGHAIISRAPGPEAAALRSDDRRTLGRLIATLPEEQREVLLLREIEELVSRNCSGHERAHRHRDVAARARKGAFEGSLA
jgi:RNA polymerase sigma-70 factor (ECF subfamily)